MHSWNSSACCHAVHLGSWFASNIAGIRHTCNSVVQWHPFSFLLVASRLKMGFPNKGSLFLSKITEQLRQRAWHDFCSASSRKPLSEVSTVSGRSPRPPPWRALSWQRSARSRLPWLRTLRIRRRQRRMWCHRPASAVGPFGGVGGVGLGGLGWGCWVGDPWRSRGFRFQLHPNRQRSESLLELLLVLRATGSH